LNQVEIYFSILQRKALTPKDFEDLLQLEQIILDFQKTYERAAKPFAWKFSRKDLRNVLNNFDSLRVPKKRAA
jgi:hypothetical protein